MYQKKNRILLSHEHKNKIRKERKKCLKKEVKMKEVLEKEKMENMKFVLQQELILKREQ